jgi:hypothetical protein
MVKLQEGLRLTGQGKGEVSRRMCEERYAQKVRTRRVADAYPMPNLKIQESQQIMRRREYIDQVEW